MAVDIVGIGLELQTKGLKQGITDLDALGKTGKKTEQDLKGLTGQTDKASSSIGSMAGVARTAQIALAGLATNGIIKVADSYSAMQGQLKLVTTTTNELISVQARLNAVSMATFASQAETTKLYSTMQPALQTLGKTTSDTIKFVETFNKALSLTAPTTAQSQAAILQFAQAMGSGVLRGDEFNSMMENGRGVMMALADGMGRPIGELRALAEQGKLTADVVYAALSNASQKIESDFAKMPMTVGKGLQNLETGFFNLVGAVDQASGATAGLASVLNEIGQVFNDLAPLMTAYGLASSDANKAVGELSPSIDQANKAGSVMYDVFNVLATNFYDFNLAVDALILDIGLLYAVLNQEIKLGMWDDLKRIYGEYEGQLDTLNKKSIAFKDSLEMRTIAAETSKGLKSIDEELKDIFGSMGDTEKATIKLGTATDKTKKSVEKLRDVYAELERELAPIKAAMERIAKADNENLDKQWAQNQDYVRDLVTLYEAGYLTIEQLRQKSADRQYQIDLESMGKIEKNQKETADAVKVAWEQSIRRLDDAFANVWEDIFSGAEDFGSSLKRWFTSLLAELAHQAITKPIVMSFAGSMGLSGTGASAASSGMSALSTVGTGASIYNAYNAITTGIGSMATTYGAMAAGAGSAQAAMLAAQSGSFGLQGAALTTGALAGGGTAATSVLSSVASAAPYIAAALVVDQLTGGAISTGIMGGARGERTRSLNIGVQNGQATSESNIYRATHYDAGWGRSGSWNVDNLGGAEFNKVIKDTVNVMAASIKDNAERLGFAFNEGFSGQFDADLFGKTAEETQQIVADTFKRIGQGMVDSVDGLTDAVAPFVNDGESSYETLSRLTTQFDLFNYPIGRLNDSLSTLNLTTLGAVDALTEMAGGVANLQAMQSNFINAFYTDAQKAELNTQTVTAIFESLNMTAPQSRESLVSVVEGLDLTTESGRNAYVALTSATGAIDAYYQNIERAQQEAQQSFERAQQEAQNALARVQAAVERAQQDVINAVNAEKQAIDARYDVLIAQEQNLSRTRVDALNKQVSAARESLNLMRSLQNALRSTVGKLSPTFTADRSGFMGAVGQIESYALSGIIPTQDQIQDALDRVATQDTSYYATFEDYKRDQSFAANASKSLLDLVNSNVESTERTILDLETTIENENANLISAIAKLELEAASQKSLLDNQLNALGLINESVLSVRDAITALNLAQGSGYSAFAQSNRSADETYLAAKLAQLQATGKTQYTNTDQVAGAIAYAGMTPQEHYAKYGASEGVGTLYTADSAIQSATTTNREQEYLSAKLAQLQATGQTQYQNIEQVKGAFLQAGLTAEQHYQLYGKNEGLPSFDVGTNYVPRDMTANIHEGEMIVPAKYNPMTSGIGNGEMVAELQALRAELAELKQLERQIGVQLIKDGKRTADKLEQWDVTGLKTEVIA